ncbi:YcxB family protein [Streptomyces yaanensis]|uniref:YcxB family protein n=1 Tax=Streptomyces yaanensis TaxID=1142239 RepID=A0ABV7SLH6_9ACTN|nr:YcxB family protein [Streptomyces sp. CGMCC 4.7035]WNC01736.1 YcxB family protein [Streptomyces sp. CGMCC 4.7035]
MVMDMGRDAVQDVVELVYQPVAKDYVRGLRARSGVSRAGKLRKVAFIFLAIALCMEALLALTGGHLDWRFAGWAALVVVLLLLQPMTQGRQLFRFAQRQGTFRASVADTGLTVVTDNSTVNVNWTMQPRYRETPELFVLMSGDKNATGMTILPKRGAQHPADVDRLRAILDRHLTRV